MHKSIKFTESEVVNLGEACKIFECTPVRYLGRGTYNHAWKVLRNNKECTLRIRVDPDSIELLTREAAMFKIFSDRKLGVPFYRSHIIVTERTKGILALLYKYAERDLEDYLQKAGQKSPQIPQIPPEVLGRRIVRHIRKVAANGYFYGDAKPGNLFIMGDSVVFGDLDPIYTVKDPGPKVDKRSLGFLRTLYVRCMLFQLSIFLKTIPTRSARVILKIIHRSIRKSMLQGNKRILTRKGQVINPYIIIHSLLRESNYPRYALDHYTGKNGTIYSAEFRKTIANYLGKSRSKVTRRIP